MAYAKTADVSANVTDATADQYNSLRVETKAAAEGLVLHDSDIAVTWSGGLPTVITITDTEGSTSTDIDSVSTITWTAGLPTQVATVYSRLGVTMTEVLTWSSNQLTAIARTLS